MSSDEGAVHVTAGRDLTVTRGSERITTHRLDALVPTTADQAAAQLVVFNMRALGRKVPEHILELATGPTAPPPAKTEGEAGHPPAPSEAPESWAANPRNLYGGWRAEDTFVLSQLAQHSVAVRHLAPQWLDALRAIAGAPEERRDIHRQLAAQIAMSMMWMLAQVAEKRRASFGWNEVLDLRFTTAIHRLTIWLRLQGLPNEVLHMFERDMGDARVALQFDDQRARAVVTLDQAEIEFDFTDAWGTVASRSTHNPQDPINVGADFNVHESQER